MAITGSVRSIRAGGAAIDLSVRDMTTRGLNRAGRRLQKWSHGVAANLRVVMLAFTGLATTAAVTAYKLIRVASDMEESMNKFDVMFGEAADSVREWGYELGEAVGRSKKQIVDMLGSFKALTTSLGMADEQGTELSKTMTELAIDLGSFYNMADEEALQRLHSALVGNHETLRKFGIAITETSIKQRAFNEGLNPAKLTDIQKAQIRYNIILESTRKQQGDAIRTAHTFANQWKILWAQISNTALALGNMLLGPATGLLHWINDAIRALGLLAKANELTASMIWDIWSKAVVMGIANALQWITGAAEQFFRNNVERIQEWGNAAVDFFYKIADSIRYAYQAAIKWIVDTTERFLNWWSEGLGDALNPVKAFYQEVFDMQDRTLQESNRRAKLLVAGWADLNDTVADGAEVWKDYFGEMKDQYSDAYTNAIQPLLEAMQEVREGADYTGSSFEKMAVDADKLASAAGRISAATAPSTIIRGAAGASASMYNIQAKAQQIGQKQLEELKKATRHLSHIQDALAGMGAV